MTPSGTEDSKILAERQTVFDNVQQFVTGRDYDYEQNIDDLFGKFKNNELKTIELVQNTEMIYYLYDDDTNELIGIDKAICSSIIMEINNNSIKEITFITNPEGEVFPEKDIELSLKILNGFNWRISEKITKKEEIFIK